MGKGSFQVYKSSAGSGKTYTLVKEYLKIVLPQPQKMRHILAITFTNAAAAEMKSRIIEELEQIASLAQTPDNKKARNLLNEILEGLKVEGKTTPPEDLLIANAQKVLTEILHNYSDFSVSTIDSFVHRIVRTFAFDLRIPVNFEIELDADSLLTKAVDMLISRAGSDQKLTDLLILYIITQADEEKSLRIESEIGKLAKTLMDEDSAPFIEKLKDLSLDEFMVIQQNIKGKIRAFENNAQKRASEAMELIDSQSLSAEHFYRGKTGIYNYFLNLSKGHVEERVRPNSYVRTTLEEGKWYGGKTDTTAKTAIDSIKIQLQQACEDIFGQSDGYLNNYQLLKAVSQNLFPLGVLNEVQRILEEIKAENVLLHISDFNRKISAIVAEQPVPFIYERIGERYQHYMIDEFQDTSVLQWQNLLPLVENGLATGNMSLVVGDGKQAIYRWRNGDVEQFVKLPELPQGISGVSKEQWQATLKRNFQPENLGTNWRSRQVIVDFNNRFFEMAKDSLSGKMQQIYLDQQQNWRKDAQGGYVEISFLEKTEEQSYEEVTLERVRLTIERLLDAGHPYSDITILCRANNKGSLLARYLLRHQIPVISSDSLLLNQSEEVIFFIAILKLLANRHDAVAGLEMIHYLLSAGYLKNQQNLQETLSGLNIFPIPTGQRLDWQKLTDQLLEKEGLAFSFAGLAYLNLFDVCENITRHFFTQDEPNPFVAFFMDAVFDYSEKNSLSVSDFLEWWEDMGHKYSLVVPQGLNAVQIMTIHKSKGLQFPVVIFAFADLGADKATKKGYWVSPDEELFEGLGAVWLKMGKSSLENTPYFPLYELEMERSALDMLNMAYVAMTRPKEKLFILTKNPGANKPTRPKLQHFFAEYLKQNQLWQEEQREYAFGPFDPSGQEQAPPNPAEAVFRRLFSRSWTGALRMRSNQQEWGLASAGQRERGKLLHRAMEQIITTNDITPVLARMCADGEIDQATQKEWDLRIRELLSLEALKPCFEPGATVKTEAGLFDENGNFYRPDRVVLLNEKTVVIDYKTGREYHSHREQIETYAKLLQSMGYPAVEKLLLYLDEYKLKSV